MWHIHSPRSEPTTHEERAEIAHTGYDAQADLALASYDHTDDAGEVFAPYAGMLTPDPAEPGYDLDRDIAT